MHGPASPPAFAYVGEDDSAYFRFLHGRKLNTLNETYLLPVDDDEVKVPPTLLSHSPYPTSSLLLLSVRTVTTVYFSLSSGAKTT
jgi:hypothetical protein